MTVWRHNISWMRIKDALECPYRLQLSIDKVPFYDSGPNYYMELGKIVQFIFEMYFNQGINLDPSKRTPGFLAAVTKKVLASPYYKDKAITYPLGMTEEDLIKDINDAVQGGLEIFLTTGIIERKVLAEKKWISRFSDIGLFGMTDFTLEDHPDGVEIWDGKGHKQKNADPRQIQHYALTIASSGRKLRKGGLLYWRYGAPEGIEEVDVSPAAVHRYVQEVMDTVRPTINALRKGVEGELPANSSSETCYGCFRKKSCKYSYYRRPDVEDPQKPHQITLDGSAV